jgi:hypothetical protein
MLVIRRKKSSDEGVCQTHQEGGKDEHPEEIERCCRERNNGRGEARIGKRGNANTVINKVKEVENENVREPAKESESEEVDGKQEKLDDGREEKIKDDKHGRSNEVG